MSLTVCLALVVVGFGAPGGPEVLTEGLVIPPVGRSGRAALHQDAIEAQIVAGRWRPPAEGDTVTLPGGTVRSWARAKAGPDGWFDAPALAGGYAYVPYLADRERVVLLNAAGHSMAYVNGEPRGGDVYATGTVRLPVRLRQGRNDLLFPVGRGRLRVAVEDARAPVTLSTDDATLPDLVVGERGRTWASVVLVNSTERTVQGLSIRAGRTRAATVTTPLPPVAPLTVRKVGFRVDAAGGRQPGDARLTVELRRRETTLDTARVSLRVRRLTETRKRTFVSEIDGSVQVYAVNPATPPPGPQTPHALVLSLHGAGVEAIGQADAYSSKTWADIVCPTNRRPYGFDWEGWGRLDAMEALRHASAELKPDPSRVYLTGHSMGGHGTWQIGAVLPDRFAAIGPSAGWISFSSYAGSSRPANPSRIDDILLRAASPSDTLALVRNYAQQGVYILHGAADDNVPVAEARTMAAELGRFHHDWVYHEQPGAGHWWDASDEPGADCVDWQPMFDLFARRRLPSADEVRDVDFTTSTPGVSATCHWVTVESQVRPLRPSHVHVRWDPGKRRFAGATDNVACVSLDLSLAAPGAPVRVELDGTALELPWPQRGTRVWLARTGGAWVPVPAPLPTSKGPARSGPFKQAFGCRMVFVYGTAGSAEEAAWSYSRARFDAESWWYRGNGSVDVVADSAFDARREPDRSVILYGNAETNGAWASLLADSPVQVRRDGVTIGSRAARGEDLACLLVRPRPGSDTACVAVVGGTGLSGARLTERLPYFLSGVEYPDCIVLGPETLTQGSAGVRAAGFFGGDWGIDTGEFAWASP